MRVGRIDCVFKNPALTNDVLIAFAGKEEDIDAEIDGIRKLCRYQCAVLTKAWVSDLEEVPPEHLTLRVFEQKAGAWQLMANYDRTKVAQRMVDFKI